MTATPDPLTPDPDAFAQLLCDWCLEVSPGQQVLVNSTTLAEPIVRAVHRAILERDAWPGIRMSPSSLGADFYRHATARHLDGFAPADLAELAAIALSQAAGLDGITPPLASTEAVDLTALAAIASEVHGREITRVTVSEDEYRDTLIAQGTPERFAEMFLGMFQASRRGDFASTDPTLERLIGHPPIAIRDVLADGPGPGR